MLRRHGLGEACLPVPAHLLSGTGDRVVPAAAVTGWARHLTGPVAEHALPGGHRFAFDDSRSAVLGLLGELLGGSGARGLSRVGVTLWWWRAGQGDAAEAAALALLTPDERRAWRRIALAGAARRFGHRRAARRVVLAHHLGLPPARIDIAEAPRGRPYLAAPAGAPCFSATGTGDLAILAICDGGPVGVDAEMLRPLADARLADRLLPEGPRARWREADPAEGAEMLLHAWTATEAVLKASGAGLDLDLLGQVAVDEGGEGWQQVRLGPALAATGPWHLCRRRLAEDGQTALIAVAVRCPGAVTLAPAAPVLRASGLG